jgi:hypothetical protein
MVLSCYLNAFHVQFQCGWEHCVYDKLMKNVEKINLRNFVIKIEILGQQWK